MRNRPAVIYFKYPVVCLSYNIDLDKGGYLVNIFLIIARKHMLWVLIRSASGLGEALLMSTHNICFRAEIRKISIPLD